MVCSDYSECTAWDIHRDEAKFEESTEHAGLTNRNQISPQEPAVFASARKFGGAPCPTFTLFSELLSFSQVRIMPDCIMPRYHAQAHFNLSRGPNSKLVNR